MTSEFLHKKLQEVFGFDHFKGEQEKIIQNVLKRKNTFVLMPTGGGKSLCYQLPALIEEGTAIVVSPLIALMKNQVDALRGYAEDDSITHFLNSSLNKQDTIRVKEDVTAGKTKLLYVAPETLTKPDNLEFFSSFPVSFVAIDEAHCISEWGHDFRPEYRKIRQTIDSLGNLPIIALTATATLKVQHDIQKNLNILDAEVFKASFNRPNLYYEVRPKVNPVKEIIRIIHNNPNKSIIVYCLSRKKVEELAQTFQVNDIKALPYHAGLDSNTRASHQDQFLKEEINVIVATIAFGMGIDKPDVRFVIHYDIPKSLESYYQETGRAGRDNGEGQCIAFYSYKDIIKLEKFMQGKPLVEQEINKQLLAETASFAESSVCRRITLLNYFGEDIEACGNCDNCLNPKEKFEGKDHIVLLLSIVNELKEGFKIDIISDVLVGNLTAEVASYKLDLLEDFGAGDEYDKSFWISVIRQTLIKKMLNKEIENYGLITITDKGKAYLENPTSITLTKHIEYNEEDREVNNFSGGGSGDPILVKQLKLLRKEVAKRNDVPPYVVFQDNSLDEMSINYPLTTDELMKISGVGAGKVSRYGAEFVELIKAYVEENEIERPDDFVIRNVVKKSGDKLQIIKSVDRKVPLDQIADSLGIDMEQLIKKLEAIVYSGTKLNIKYYVESEIDEDKVEEVYEYFMEVDDDNMADALDEFEEYGFTEEEIRLVRIMFISEVAN